MALVSGTKWLFAKTLRDMLRENTLRQIKVIDLCKACGADRQTFYYHFRDKYDLVAWIYEQTFQEVLRGSGGVFRLEEMEKLLLAFQEDRVFYKKVFYDHSQNSLMSYIQEVNVNYTRKGLLKEQNTDSLSQEIEFSMRFFSHAWIGCMKDWISEDHGIDAKQYAKLLYDNTSALVLRNPVTIYHE